MARSGAKRVRADSTGDLPVKTVDSAPPPKKRAVLPSKGKGKEKAVADKDESDEDDRYEDDSDDDEEEVALTAEEVKAAIISGEMMDDLHDDDYAEDEFSSEDEADTSEAGLQTKSPELVVNWANKDRFNVRLHFMIVTLIAHAKEIDGKSYFNGHSADQKLPLTWNWWVFLNKVDVQNVLGQETFGRADLLPLVGDWRDKAWGVYLGILTKITDSSWYRLYVGSETGKDGFWQRIIDYIRWIPRRDRGDAPTGKGGRHERTVFEPGVEIQVRQIS